VTVVERDEEDVGVSDNGSTLGAFLEVVSLGLLHHLAELSSTQ
jgi:hypothetical protein